MLRTLLFTLILFSTSSVLGSELATYRFAIQKFNGTQNVVHQMVVSLDDEAQLKVVLNKAIQGRSVFFDSVGTEQVFEKEVNSFVFDHLIHDIIRLANAPVKKTVSEIVCMMMPGPAQSNDHLSVRRVYDRGQKKFWGELEVIYSPSGCWIANKVFPEAQIDRNQANSLKAKLKTLALEMIGNDL
jgi:hypothetical protein